MILYIPERLYRELKDKPKYIELDKRSEAIYSEIKTFEDATKYSILNNEEVSEIFSELDALVKSAFKDKPNYIEEYFINNGKYSKKEMLDRFYTGDPKVYDFENKFYLLSNIINTSYEDETFPKYLGVYTELFESLSAADKQPLSKYIWLKYMYAKIYTLASEYTFEEANWYKNFAKYVEDIYGSTIVAIQDEDITLNYAMEAVNDSIHLFLQNGAGLNGILQCMMLFIDLVKENKFQYSKYSLAVLNFMDIKNMLYMIMCNYTGVYHQTSIICDYISESLKDMKELLRGLEYYDKCNQNLYAILIRKYLRLLKEVPLFEDLKIENLSEVDKEYIMSDRIGTEVFAADPNKITDTYTVKDTDSFFSDTNEVLKQLKSLPIEG